MSFQEYENRLALITAETEKIDIDLYRTQIRQAEAKVRFYENQLNHSKLISPAQGKVVKINKKVGELVQPVSQDGVIVILDGKTGMRRIRIVSSEVLLKKYLEQRAGSKSLESPLWTKEAGTQLSYGAIAKLIRVGVANAGIKKHVHPHLFRHSRATFLASRLTEAQMNNYLGWTQGSGMAKTYVHLSGKDVDNAILAMHGKREKQKINESKLVQIKCKRCMEVNPIGASYCIKCGAPLSVEIMLKYENKRKEKDDVMNMLLNDSDIKELIIQKLKGMSND